MWGYEKLKKEKASEVTTEERIDAIAMHLELTARMVEDNEKRLSRILTIIEKSAEIAQNHERRIQNLEGEQ